MFNSNASSADAGGANYIEDVFSTWLYTGNDSSQTINNGIDLAGKGGLVWVKSRTQVAAHELVDTVRGADNRIFSNLTSAQDNSGSVDAFNSNGFTLRAAGLGNLLNEPTASWTFRKQPKFFDVVTYTGTGSAQDIAHNLGSVPGCIIVKGTTNTFGWYGYHRSLTSSETILLNSTDAAVNVGAGAWNSTTPTSTVFSVGNGAGVNQSGQTYVAYLFAHDAGGFGLNSTDNVISCGSYTGTGAAGNAVTLGYEPQWVMVKRTDTAGFNWAMQDNIRGMSLTGDAILYANLSNAEADSSPTAHLYPTATGFTLGSTATGWNASGGTYIYIAIRRGPMKTPTDGTKVFSPIARTGTGTNNLVVNTTNRPDMVFPMFRDSAARDMYDRLRGPGQTLVTSSTAAENNNFPSYGPTQFGNTSYTQGNSDGVNYNASGLLFVDWLFTRAPGFFDEVCTTLAGVSGNDRVSHNLGVPPELIIMKARATVNNWYSYNAPQGINFFMRPNTTDASGNAANSWGTSNPTSTDFGVASNFFYGTSETVVCYLFATCPGVSKVGSYTGTATTLQINCGFTAGARFVLIKRTDSTGDWYVWDSARGIVAGNDPYLLLNSTAAEVTGTDYVDTYSAGFELTSTAPAALNASGGSYIFLAIA